MSVIGSYFGQDYEQYVDDEYINYSNFIKHVEKVRGLIENLKIEFLQLIEENDVVFSRHKAITVIDGQLLL